MPAEITLDTLIKGEVTIEIEDQPIRSQNLFSPFSLREAVCNAYLAVAHEFVTSWDFDEKIEILEINLDKGIVRARIKRPHTDHAKA